MTSLYHTTRNVLIATLVVAAVGGGLQAQPPAVHPPQPPRRVTEQPLPDPGRLQFRIPEGTPIAIRPIQTISSKTHDVGAIFEAILDQDLEVDNQIVVPKGNRVFGEVVERLEGGKVKGRAELTVTLRELEIAGINYPIETSPITVVAQGSKVNDARNVGIAAGIGAIIGAIAGGKKGAAVGATIGGGAQTARVLTSRGEAAEIEKERLLSFRLEKELLNWE